MDIITYILAKNYTNKAIADLPSTAVLEYVVVDSLPDVGESGFIYLIHKKDDVYDEYIWDKGTYDKLRERVITSLLIKGYYFGGVFWKDAGHNTRLPDTIQHVYLDLDSKELYYFDTQTQHYDKFIKTATEEEPGLVKLYTDSGEHTDGTMTQKAITTKLKKKVEVNLDKISSEELGLELNKA